MGYAPPRPAGNNTEARFAQWVWDELHARRLNPSPDVLVNRTTRGDSIIVKQSGATTGVGIHAVQLKIKVVNLDTLTCVTWDGANEGLTQFEVAKPPALRVNAFTGRQTDVGGIIVTIAGTGVQARTITEQTGLKRSYSQITSPTYAVGTLLYAIDTVSGGTAKDGVSYLDLNVDARAWATLIPICDSQVNCNLPIVGATVQKA